MRNTLISVLLILAGGACCRLGLPWWAIAPVGALVGWSLPQPAWRSMSAGFVAGFLLWAWSAWSVDSANNSLLSTRVGEVFLGLSPEKLVVLTGILGGLLAGLGCWTGRCGREWYDTVSGEEPTV